MTTGSSCADDMGLENIELPPSIHLPFDELELGNLPVGQLWGDQEGGDGIDCEPAQESVRVSDTR